MCTSFIPREPLLETENIVEKGFNGSSGEEGEIVIRDVK
jgi:hypothetical protein